MAKKPTAYPRRAVLTRYKDGTPVIKIEFPFSWEDVDTVKRIPGRKFHERLKIWTCPPTTVALHILQEAQFHIDDRLRGYVRSQNLPAIDAIPRLLKEPYKYQLEGISFAQSRGGRCLIADEQGLGKTIQAIGWMVLNPDRWPVIIVCPSVAKWNWRKEIRDWIPKGGRMVQVLEGETPYELTEKIIIVNYDILHLWMDTILAYNPQVAIIDEIQYVKNGKALRTKAVRKLSKRVNHLIALSGTPITNRPIEFYNGIQMIDPNLFPNWISYADRYCDRKHNGFGWDVSGSTNTEELHQLLTESIMIRRKKSEVLSDLPDKVRSFYPMEMSPAAQANYEKAEDNFLKWVELHRGIKAAERASNAAAMTEIEVLKQVAVEGKLPHAIEWIKDFLNSGEKLVVFATHKFVIDALMAEFKNKAVKVDGTVTGSKRHQAVQKFQNEEEIRLFVGNIYAAGVAITLTAASNVAFLELPWTPGALVQAEDRCHRIGQKDTVNVYYLLAEYTIEEKIAALLDEKRKVLTAVLDGTDVDESSLIMDLIENY